MMWINWRITSPLHMTIDSLFRYGNANAIINCARGITESRTKKYFGWNPHGSWLCSWRGMGWEPNLFLWVGLVSSWVTTWCEDIIREHLTSICICTDRSKNKLKKACRPRREWRRKALREKSWCSMSFQRTRALPSTQEMFYHLLQGCNNLTSRAR